MQLPERIGPFRTLREIGSGGMGVVALARQVDSKRTVALKVLAPELAKSAEARERFQREVRAASALDHPAIVPVWEYGEADGLLYFAMRHVEGRPLSELLVEGQGASPPAGLSPERGRVPWIVEIVETCARALHHAHLQHVVHRDVKPSNVLIDESGAPHLVDFGLAYIEGRHSITESGRLLGTIPYMAPEVVSGQRTEVDGRTDVFSLGVLLYEALTGRKPFEGKSREAIFHGILFKEPIPPRKHVPEISRDLETIALKCLEKDPDRRYRTALALAEDLERLRTFRPILARPLGPLGRARRFARRNPALALVSLASAALVIGLLALLVSQIVAREVAYERMELALASTEEARARSQLLADAFEAEALLEVESRPFALQSAELPAIARWRQRAADLRSREELYLAAQQGAGKHAAALRATGRLEEMLAARIRLAEVERSVAAREQRVLVEFAALSAEFASAWEKAREELAADPRFAGISLASIEGLVPLGPNEVGLQEFWHVASGSRPALREGGGWEMQDESGIVLVLLPPGRLAMGSRDGDPPVPKLPAPEPPQGAHEVPAYFLARHEVTQSQWQRVWGSNPSNWADGETTSGGRSISGTHPVEKLNWEQAQEYVRRLGLRLPSELEWEYAARAGGDRYYAGSDEPGSLETRENVADASFKNAPVGVPETWSDEFPVHAPIGSFAANAFGLHDMLGNVSEWTSDAFELEYAGDGSAAPDGVEKSYRGGNWYLPAAYGRTTYRQHTVKGNAMSTLGLRVARSLR